MEIKQPNSLLFLAFRHFIRRENSEIWYMRAPLGKNQIGKLLRTAADNTGIQRIGTKVSNHSVRKTSILRLLDANTPENFVAQLSGHKNTQSCNRINRQINNTSGRCHTSSAEHHKMLKNFQLYRIHTICRKIQHPTGNC